MPELNGVLESGVVLQSLRQSREQWMYSILPKFSGRVRGKADVNPPPHTIQARGRCQIEIGPHIFWETSFWEVQYQPLQAPWQSPYAAYAPQQAPLLSSLYSATAITPALINQVNARAAADPLLNSLLQLAAAGQASPEQIQSLGLLIQSLTVPGTPEASSPQVYKKEWDLVISFHETPYDRWIIPRCPAICEKVNESADSLYDVVLTLAMKPPPSPTEPMGWDKPPQVVTIRCKRPPPAVWELLWRWVGGEEKLNENRAILEDLKKNNSRALLLTSLQAAAPQYVMKHIKPGPEPRPKRKPPQRKPSAPAGSTPTPQQPSSSTSAASSTSSAEPDPKRRKIAPTTKIRCHTCQKSDVPLVYGGRYCRDCVQAGKIETVYVPYKPPQYQYQPTPGYIPSPLATTSTTPSAPS
ncbi:hypothetical protein FB45DRAFT_917670 [Roridomyces roridus]|uniref:Uncharacterized protein n=1 Tax=Roridomyces roridus TaxID=1738132 RepID=A0AAD7BUT4_9AGAR|nr:hypothetical protein FB45DRAFT_917670 [Roridomyces roridus]